MVHRECELSPFPPIPCLLTAIRHGIRIATSKAVDSVLDNNHLDDFIAIAQMDEDDFEVQRPKYDEPILVAATNAKTQAMQMDNFDFSHLTFPKKPTWAATMTAEVSPCSLCLWCLGLGVSGIAGLVHMDCER